MRDPATVLLPILVWFVFAILVGRLAAWFHRSPGTWFLLALLLSPLVAFIGLLLAGDPQQAATRHEQEERIRQQHPDRKDIREVLLNEMTCPHCGAAVNPVTGDGLSSPQAQPWLLICNRCQNAIEPDV
ncbi:hypothetical protein AYO44_01710 [Planctomycetaceae bacterium SCGC AG-212-F19]|nr:hypothetical protein AYO44_01710 [Planctomycetaceae bacterium SCGC AG-212-F19]